MNIPLWAFQVVWTGAYIIAALVSGYNSWDGWQSLIAAKEGDTEDGVNEISIRTARLFFGIQATLGAFATGMAVAGGLAVFFDDVGQIILLILTLGAPVVGGLAVWITSERRKIFDLLAEQTKIADHNTPEGTEAL